MSKSFVYTNHPAKVVFGKGGLASLPSEIEAAGCRRALVLSTPFQRKQAERVAELLGPVSVGTFSDATMHTPTGVTERAMQAFAERGADCVVAFGGGSTIGLGKAIAYRNDTFQFVVATTYAGSEVTPILGQTENGLKTTLRSPRVLPEVVIYDSELTLDLPVKMSVNSGLNAMAHAVEGLYARDQNPITSMFALEGLRALKQSLPKIVASPQDINTRDEALYGSWLCGSVLGSVSMALHHKLCHTLGGSFDLPHAETHAVILAHATAYNSVAAADRLRPAADLFGGELAQELYDFAAFLGAPLALKDLGMLESDLDRTVDLVCETPYWNPRAIERGAIRSLLQDAWEGKRPK